MNRQQRKSLKNVIIGFTMCLMATAAILKVMGGEPFAHYSWWLITAPIWVTALVATAIIVLILAVGEQERRELDREEGPHQ